jgi:hypothetical protein
MTDNPTTLGFDVQERPSAPAYFYLCCRSCKLTFYLPKDAARRTKEAHDILVAHAAAHRVENTWECHTESTERGGTRARTQRR